MAWQGLLLGWTRRHADWWLDCCSGLVPSIQRTSWHSQPMSRTPALQLCGGGACTSMWATLMCCQLAGEGIHGEGVLVGRPHWCVASAPSLSAHTLCMCLTAGLQAACLPVLLQLYNSCVCGRSCRMYAVDRHNLMCWMLQVMRAGDACRSTVLSLMLQC